MKFESFSDDTSPKSPPPSPPLPSNSITMKPTTEVQLVRPSPFIQKMTAALDGHYYYSEGSDMGPDFFTPKTGPYFFYGTLSDPSLLSDVLGLDELPTLRPATLMGYSCKLWGQYPALVDGPTGHVVQGAMYEVKNEKDAQRLSDYETKAYTTAPCLIKLSDGLEPDSVSGWTFKYNGNPIDLSEGCFDLAEWLRLMKRK